MQHFTGSFEAEGRLPFSTQSRNAELASGARQDLVLSPIIGVVLVQLYRLVVYPRCQDFCMGCPQPLTQVGAEGEEARLEMGYPDSL